ncbi:type II secretion system protein GspJ [Calycomorphotria hydatis]|uniref:Type II secretion system protein J n=1 Tax=Calycomorphotria hydatis TaxID=2528027 RepID=A0A517T5J1_9PLAN|nr:type II secretion system protein GspJ [Calycomorphotria hydatis]QDT63628.1 Pseudopilin GspJ [Calycomorphotria hydatis]
MTTSPHLLRRRAFTLVEVILALALSVVLMAAILSALELTRRLVSTGREEIERAQISRAVFQKISRDLRSVTFRVDSIAAEEEATSTDATDEESTAEEEPEEEATVIGGLTAETSLLMASGGLVGDSSALVMQICRPPRLDFRTNGTAMQSSRVSELQSVSYFIAAPNAGGLAGAVGDAFGAVGLSRLSGDRLAIQQADEEGNLGLLADSSELLAPEITAVYFRYFDGSAWVETWDTSVTRQLPSAVEVTFVYEEVDGDAGITNTSSTLTVDADNTWRGVISLPLAGAYAAEAALEELQ